MPGNVSGISLRREVTMSNFDRFLDGEIPKEALNEKDKEAVVKYVRALLVFKERTAYNPGEKLKRKTLEAIRRKKVLPYRLYISLAACFIAIFIGIDFFSKNSIDIHRKNFPIVVTEGRTPLEYNINVLNARQGLGDFPNLALSTTGGVEKAISAETSAQADTDLQEKMLKSVDFIKKVPAENIDVVVVNTNF